MKEPNRACHKTDNGLKKIISDRLKELRAARDFNYSQAAAFIGVGQSVYHRWEEGISAPTISCLVKIANAYDISLDFLVGRDNKNS